MPRVLAENEVDLEQEAVDAVLTQAEEEAAEAATRLLAADERVPDLTDGGVVGGAKLSPRQQGRKVPQGRPAARRAWTWNGSDTLLPLAWNPDGTMHDGARRYLLKKHCTCCGFSGFRGIQCPACVKNSCSGCNSSTVRGKIIPNFYLRKEDVPFPQRIYGNIDCFLEGCPRHGSLGFKTEQDMRMHARTRHKMEYQSYLEERASGGGGGVDLAAVEKRLSDLEAIEERLRVQAEAEDEKKRLNQERMAKVRGARGNKRSRKN